MSDRDSITKIQHQEASHYSIEVRWSAEDDIFIAEIPELSGVRTHGASPAEAVEMAVEAAALWLEIAREEGWQIPEPRLARVAS